MAKRNVQKESQNQRKNWELHIWNKLTNPLISSERNIASKITLKRKESAMLHN
jgi:hypothetical protein